jgi:hypothetical protein
MGKAEERVVGRSGRDGAYTKCSLSASHTPKNNHQFWPSGLQGNNVHACGPAESRTVCSGL